MVQTIVNISNNAITRSGLQWLACVALALCHLTQAQARTVSTLKADESLVFFASNAWLNEATKQWHIPIHGWVFEPTNSTVRKTAIAKSMRTVYGLQTDADTERNFTQRVNWLLADNERGKAIVIRFANRTYALPESEANGHFKSVIQVDAQILQQQNIQKSFSYQAVLKSGDDRVFTGQVNLVKPKGWSVISDIDDTVKISKVKNKKQLLAHTFLLDFKAVSGMSELYQRWQQEHRAVLHWVSSSPWQLYPELDAFLTASGFPKGEFNLKSVRFMDSSLLNLFKPGIETKPAIIANIIERFPDRSFVLVGDSGEHDPEVYARIQQQFPEQIKHILIHNVTHERLDNQRFSQLLTTTDASLWQLFNQVDELKMKW